MTFEDALDRLSSMQRADGIAYAFQEDAPFVGVDFDDVRAPETGQVEPEAEGLILDLQSYTEISSSGTGFHIILTGERDPGYLHKGELGTGHLEIYDTDRYFVLTADRYRSDELPENPKPAGQVFTSIEGEYLRYRSVESNPKSDYENEVVDDWIGSKENGLTHQTKASLPTPAEVRATGSKYDEHFGDLWRGLPVQGVTDHSRLDSKLVSKLVYWCQRDPSLIDECFRLSDRYNIRPYRSTPRWDDTATSAGRTYGEHLISACLDFNDGCHGDHYITPE